MILWFKGSKINSQLTHLHNNKISKPSVGVYRNSSFNLRQISINQTKLKAFLWVTKACRGLYNSDVTGNITLSWEVVQANKSSSYFQLLPHLQQHACVSWSQRCCWEHEAEVFTHTERNKDSGRRPLCISLLLRVVPKLYSFVCWLQKPAGYKQ